jgi:hypothetical protein
MSITLPRNNRSCRMRSACPATHRRWKGSAFCGHEDLWAECQTSMTTTVQQVLDGDKRRIVSTLSGSRFASEVPAASSQPGWKVAFISSRDDYCEEGNIAVVVPVGNAKVGELIPDHVAGSVEETNEFDTVFDPHGAECLSTSVRYTGTLNLKLSGPIKDFCPELLIYVLSLPPSKAGCYLSQL